MTTDGIVLLDKPVGITSNAALSRLKRKLSLRKAGHTGTLDPMASGLLVACLGQATRVAAYLLDADKTYQASVHLGLVTDSEDAEGEIIGRHEVPALDRAAVEAELAQFSGRIEQVPPMHSALKHQGRRLYELARAGQQVERPARRVVIHEIELTDFQPPVLSLHVRCSKGTYIRALARDIGEVLGCGAHLSALRRVASEPFHVADAVSLEALDRMPAEAVQARVLPADRALPHLPAIELSVEPARRVLQGQKLSDLDTAQKGLVRLYAAGQFLGIGELDGAGHLRPVRLFPIPLGPGGPGRQ
ncbi:MAG: tRNA pseudouridine(55) synthase TruB [Pseudomonadota bacterium]|nr:MAG: tRNA pseudouridine(55) synthase TruB [Pseudomonadota bacterium]